MSCRDSRLTLTATRASSVTASATPTGRNCPADSPDRAPSLIHSSARIAPPATITALAIQGSSRCLTEPVSFVSRLGCAALWPLVAEVSAVHLASPVRTYPATAMTAANTPAAADHDQDGRTPKIGRA